MAFSEFEHKRYEKLLKEFCADCGPSPFIRAKLRWEFRITGQSIELLETRPRWNNPSECSSSGLAKTIYVKKTREWKVYWMRADLKWHRYWTCPSVRTIEEFLELVDRDEEAAFKG
jgi:hypothetical protein